MSESLASGPQPRRILFLCTHNSSRSQMAEGLLRKRGGEAYTAFSAGIMPRVVHPLAVSVMQEIGINIGTQRAKSLEDFANQPPMDLVITVCDEAAQACPYFPNARYQVHWGFADPSRVEGSEDERLAASPAISLEQLFAAASAQEKLA